MEDDVNIRKFVSYDENTRQLVGFYGEKNNTQRSLVNQKIYFDYENYEDLMQLMDNCDLASHLKLYVICPLNPLLPPLSLLAIPIPHKNTYNK